MNHFRSLNITPVSLNEILPFRDQFLEENDFQIRYDACHARGWSDSYLLKIKEQPVGYGSVKGKKELSDRDAVFEFFVLPDYRTYRSALFSELLHISGATFIECQSNEQVLTHMMYEFAHCIYADVILFEDHHLPHFMHPELIFRRRKTGEPVYGKSESDAGEYVLEREGEIVADGGFLTHYNFPYADLYMEVKPECRNQGFGSYLLQEIKKVCYREGRIPAARCNMTNTASRATLLKAGMKVCGYMLTGEVKNHRA